MPRKGRFAHDPSNTAPDGHYIVGKGRPPESGKFKKGDGRERGRRGKGCRNLATDLREELNSRVHVTVGGVAKKVSRQRAIVMRLADNATKGQNPAIALAFELQQRLVDPILEGEEQPPARNPGLERLSLVELEILRWLTAKIEGVESEHGDVVSAIPIYKEGHYLNTRESGEIMQIFRNHSGTLEEWLSRC